MTANALYRIAALLLLLFMVGHTLGFDRIDPSWGIDSPIQALKTTTFSAQGFPGRTYWGFYEGFGYFCSVLMLLAAVFAWTMGGMSPDMLRRLQFLSWSFAGAFVITVGVTWKYFFTAAIFFSAAIAACLIAAAWQAGSP